MLVGPVSDLHDTACHPGSVEYSRNRLIGNMIRGAARCRDRTPARRFRRPVRACGKLVAAAGWHAWRDDIASAVEPELMLDPRPDGGESIAYDFILDRA